MTPVPHAWCEAAGWSRLLGWSSLLAGTACANIETPPGGPADQSPPVLVATVPESLDTYPDFDDQVEFIFNEVISEGSSPNLGFGTGTLEGLIVLSPSEQIPRVAWRRTRIGVKPREGWRPNRVYRVQLLPGVTDVERNRSDAATILTFTTGGPVPTDTLRGTMIDWTQGRPAAGGLILATLMPDNLIYRAFADSTGRFAVGPLPSGDYLVHGVVDQNSNRLMDARESFDSTSVARGIMEVGGLWAIPHDTTGPRIRSITYMDSLTVAVGFTHFLDPEQRVDSGAFRAVLLPDSIPVPVLSLLPVAEHDSLYPRATAADTAAADTTEAIDSVQVRDSLPVGDPAAFDSAGRPPLPDPGKVAGAFDEGVQDLIDSRPKLFDRLLLRFAQPLEPDGRYFVSISGLRSINGVAGDGGAGFVVPELPPPLPVSPDDSLPGTDSLPPALDSLEAAADTTPAVGEQP